MAGSHARHQTTSARIAVTDSYLPPATIGTAYVIVWSDTSGNSYFQLTGTLNVLSGTGYSCTLAYPLTSPFTCATAALTPLEAAAIDTKLDDGMPSTGRMVGGTIIPNAMGSISSIAPTSALPCVTTDSSGKLLYNTSSASLANKRTCGITFSF